MARPVGADAEATKARILARAAALVSANGIEGTSVRDIAAASEVSLATVLHYFGSKDGLYGACVAAMYTELKELQAVLTTAMSTSTPDTMLRTMVKASWVFVTAHRPAVRLALRAVLDRGGLNPEQIDQWFKPGVHAMEQVAGPALGLTSLQIRLAFQSTIHLLVRYAIHTPEELCLLAGVSDVKKAEEIIGDHLAMAGHRMFQK
jgi:AcrR family transcriptional regulator